jgi:hypothetical protein
MDDSINGRADGRNHEQPAIDAQEAWAKPVSRVSVAGISPQAVNLNVEGRPVSGPLQGFGQMWQKTFRVRLSGSPAIPEQVVSTWKANFSTFWPTGNTLFAPLTGIAPGEVAVINSEFPGGMVLSTGVRVIYTDRESFSFMTIKGHPWSAMITFSAFEEEQCTVAQVHFLIRANDPLYEMVMHLGGHEKENDFWVQTLTNLAAHFGVRGQVTQSSSCVDPRLQWRETRNIFQNAAIRSAFYTPVRLARKAFVK